MAMVSLAQFYIQGAEFGGEACKRGARRCHTRLLRNEMDAWE